MFLIQFDACNRDLLGIGSIGFVLYYDSIVLCKHYSLLPTSSDSNCAEYKALISALEFAIKWNITELYVEGDAQIIINQINQLCNINCSRLKPLFNKVTNLKRKFDFINFEHIYRKHNIFADSLANHALNNYIK